MNYLKTIHKPLNDQYIRICSNQSWIKRLELIKKNLDLLNKRNNRDFLLIKLPLIAKNSKRKCLDSTSILIKKLWQLNIEGKIKKADIVVKLN